MTSETTNRTHTNAPFVKLLIAEGGRYRKWLVIGPIFKLLEVVFDLSVPLLVARMVDQGVLQHNTSAIVNNAVLLMAMAVLGFSCTLIAQKMASVCSQGIGGILRMRLFTEVLFMSEENRSSFGASSLVTRLTSDINQIQLGIALAIRQLIRWPLIAVGSVVFACMLNLKLATIFFIAMPLVGLVFFLVIKTMIPHYADAQTSLDKLTHLCDQTLKGILSVRAYNYTAQTLTNFYKKCRKYSKHAFKTAEATTYLNPLTLVILDLGIVAILYAASPLIDQGTLAPGDLLAFINYMTQTLLAVGYVANLVIVFTKASGSAGRIAECLSYSEVANHSTMQAFEQYSTTNLKGTFDASDVCTSTASQSAEYKHPFLICNDVTFTYPGSKHPALSHISFELRAGQTLGVIGATGSGKSTLVRLLTRMYTPQAGTITINGLSLDALTDHQLAHLIALAPQKPQFIPDTLQANISWRQPNATPDELIETLTKAQGTRLLAKDERGLLQEVSPSGSNFSGGEKQRLSIARALLGTSSVLILDAATSALDAHTERLVFDAIQDYRTKIIASERVAHVANCDRILVLKHGRLEASGSHWELLKTSAEYKELFETQQGGEQHG